MNFHIITNVWGERHIDLFLSLTLPNILSNGNLPALCAFGAVRYRVFTTPADCARIQTDSSFERLASLAQIEFVAPLGDRQPGVEWHVHWFHRAAAEAKQEGAISVFIPPDTLWSDGSLRRIGELFAAGVSGICCPFLLVAVETLLPEVRSRFSGTDGVLTVPSDEIWPLAHRHIHPLQILGMPGAPHARPVFELHWANGPATLVGRYVVRELLAFDPRRCPITFLWYPSAIAVGSDLYFSKGVDDIFMLSVDPLHKYFGNYILDHSPSPIDAVRTTLHPLNDTPNVDFFSNREVRIGSSPTTHSRSLARNRARSERTRRQMQVGRRVMRLCDELSRMGAGAMAALLAVALFETPLLRRWRAQEPLTVLAPTDASLTENQRMRLRSFLEVGREAALMCLLRQMTIADVLGDAGEVRTISGDTLHVTGTGPSRAVEGHTIVGGPVQIEGTLLYVVNGCLGRV